MEKGKHCSISLIRGISNKTTNKLRKRDQTCGYGGVRELDEGGQRVQTPHVREGSTGGCLVADPAVGRTVKS